MPTTTRRKKRTEAELRAAMRRNNKRIRREKRKIKDRRKKIKRSQEIIAKNRKWRAQHQAELRRRQDPAAIAVKWGLQYEGFVENDNRAPWLDPWAREIGDWMVGQPWCGLLVWKMAQAAGVTLSKETVSTVAIKRMAESGTGGFKAWHGPNVEPRIGFVAIYGTGGPQHTGMYIGNGKVLEGNTSPGRTGSQNNGGGVYVRTLAERRGWLLGYAEIDWRRS